MRHVNMNSDYRLGKSKTMHCPVCEAERFQFYWNSIKVWVESNGEMVSCEAFECSGCGGINTAARGSSQVLRSQPMLMLAEAMEALKNGR